jgi:hypothetical protein
MESGARIEQLGLDQKLDHLASVHLDGERKLAITLARPMSLLTSTGVDPTKISILAVINSKISRRGRNRLDRSHAPTM